MLAVLFDFGEYRLDDDRVTLTGAHGPVHVEPQVFRVLQHLLLHRHRVVPKEELLDIVWGDRFVSESTLASRVKAARRAVGDDGQAQHSIKTVHGVGYHFVAEVATALAAEALSIAPPNRHLPVLRTDLIGREDDVIGVLSTVRTARATTITGPGGVGKTTLALAAAHRLQSDFSDGAIFVDLATAYSTDHVGRTLSDAAGIEGDASRSIDRLTDHLSTRRVLIVLDNCEHVLTPVAEVADRLLSRGTEARLLATSREALALPDEHVWPLAPLTAAGPELFVQRARQAEPRVTWNPTDPAIVELCARLDGLPLALELAAGQLRRWGFAELNRQLQGELTALASNAHRSGDRHGTLAAAIDWSYQLLDTSERRLLRHLSVFPSWFDVRSAETVTVGLRGVVMPMTLGELVDKSLVVRDTASGRFRLLETIRVFAREHLEADGEADAALESHRLYVRDLARATSRLDRWMSAPLAAQRRADADQARQAFWASVDGRHPDDAVEIAVGSAFLWRNAIGCTEGGGWVDELLTSDLSPTDRVWALILRADLGQGIGDFRQMLAAAAKAVQIDDGSDSAATCIANHFVSLLHLTDPTVARDHLERVLEIAADARLSNLMQTFMVVADIAAGASEEIVERLERLLAAVSEDGYDRYILHWTGWMFGLARRDESTARRWMSLQDAFLRRTGIVETWITSLSTAVSESVDGSDVRALISRALWLADREGYRAEADCVLALAYSEVCGGAAQAAAELLGTAIHSRFNNTAHYVLYRVVVEPVVRRQLDATGFAEAIELGRGRTAAEALEVYGIGTTVSGPSGSDDVASVMPRV